MKNIFETPEELMKQINSLGYIIDFDFAIALYLTYHLDKSVLLLEGPPGTGKSQIAITLSQLMNDCDPIRLQCYEGISVEEAIYSFNYKKQLLYIEAEKQKLDWSNIQQDIYSEQFLSIRPLLKSILSDKREILLIDEIDKSDEEFEAFLLELLNDFQISIPEIGTIKAKQKPFIILTSNGMRELSDALRRRCVFFYIDFPSLERELEIIHTKVEGIDDLLATQVAKFVQTLRKENLKKIPSISETIDWVRALVKLEVKTLNPKIVQNTLNLLLKTKADLDAMQSKVGSMLDKLPKKAIKIDKQDAQTTRVNKVDDILNNDGNWDF